jgi:hypothetical protein
VGSIPATLVLFILYVNSVSLNTEPGI